MFIVLNNQKIPIKIAYSWQQKVKGLMFRPKIDFGLLIPNCISVHTYFLKENIDLIFLNENCVVEYIYQNIPPKKIVMIDEDINKTSVLELPKNASLNMRIGDVLTFEFEDIV